jgi:hypothetical protein
MHRRSGQPAFSLFSFQDIVTSVTAIMILIVLILSLELITRKTVADAATPSASARSVAAAVAELEALAATLTASEPAEADAQVILVPQTVTAGELHTLRDQVDRHRDRLDTLQRVAAIARATANEAKVGLDAERARVGGTERDELTAARITDDARTIAAANAAEDMRLDKKRQELEGQPLPGQQLVFRRPRGADKTSWLLEIAEGRICALQLGTGRPRSLAQGTGDDSELGRWIDGLDPAANYILILVRPSGIGCAQTASRMIAAAHLPFGIDFIGEDHPVHDGSADEDQATAERSEDE